MAHHDRSDAARHSSFDAARLEGVRRLCREATERGLPPALALVVARGGAVVLSEAWGTIRRLEDGSAAPATPETVWLTASVTKPVVCTGLGLLLQRGELLLDDPVSRFVPLCRGGERDGMTLRHLLTHSSGLPDMLPENLALRRAHAPLSAFVERTCSTPLLFPPGTDVRYQSMGIALLGAVIEQVTGESCPAFLRRELFEPLGLSRCVLGWSEALAPDTARVVLPDWQEPGDWDWNSRYWRELGAPWGGMHATAPELARFMQWLLAATAGRDGAGPERALLSAAAAREMVRCQTAELPGLSAAARSSQGWGLGWRHLSIRESLYFGDLLSRRAYGHAGATGTAVWNDPDRQLSFVLLSNHPDAGRFIAQVGSAVVAALRGEPERGTES